MQEINGHNLRVNFPEVPRLPNGRIPTRSPSNFGGFVDSPHVKVYAGNLSWSVTSEALRETFNGKGNVLGEKFIQDRETGRSQGFRFVSFSSEDEVEVALSEMNRLVTAIISRNVVQYWSQSCIFFLSNISFI